MTTVAGYFIRLLSEQKVRAKQLRRIGLTGCALFFLALCLTGNFQIVRAADGDLDPEFGLGGKVTTDFFGDNDFARAIAVQPDGRMVAAGTAGNYAALVRYNPDGSLDPTFGSGGRVVVNAIYTNLTSLTIQADGKIFAAGTIGTANYDFFLTRYNSDGGLDTAFGEGGQVITAFDGASAELRSIVLQPDGKVFATGVIINGLVDGIAVARYKADGSLDQNFGGGRFATYFDNNRVGGYGGALQTDGKIVVSGYFNNDLALFRYDPNGNLDSTFGSGGLFRISLGNGDAEAKSVTVQLDGKIVAAGFFQAGSGNNDFILIRCNADGSLDPTFGSGGRVQTDFSNHSDDTAESVMIQANGKLIAAGHSGRNSTFNFAVARYYANGQLDQTFGRGGKATTGFGRNISQQSFAAALQPNGKIVLAGFVSNVSSGNPDFGLVRYLSTPRQTQFDFDGDGRTDLGVFRQGIWYLNCSTTGLLGFQFGWSSDQIVPADFDGDGKTDLAIFRPTDGNWYWLNSSTQTYSIVHFGQNGDLPVPADYDGDGHADHAVFRDGVWYIQRSSAGLLIRQFGLSGDKPVPADYDGDGKTDPGVYRQGEWYLERSGQGVLIVSFGMANDKPVAADYDGDGRADIAVWRPEEGVWYIFQSSTGTTRTFAWGNSTDIPAPGDYDGDGKTDLTIYRGSGGWWIWESQTNNYSARLFGNSGDTPVPSAYIH